MSRKRNNGHEFSLHFISQISTSNMSPENQTNTAKITFLERLPKNGIHVCHWAFSPMPRSY